MPCLALLSPVGPSFSGSEYSDSVRECVCACECDSSSCSSRRRSAAGCLCPFLPLLSECVLVCVCSFSWSSRNEKLPSLSGFAFRFPYEPRFLPNDCFDRPLLRLRWMDLRCSLTNELLMLFLPGLDEASTNIFSVCSLYILKSSTFFFCLSKYSYRLCSSNSCLSYFIFSFSKSSCSYLAFSS